MLLWSPKKEIKNLSDDMLFYRWNCSLKKKHVYGSATKGTKKSSRYVREKTFKNIKLSKKIFLHIHKSLSSYMNQYIQICSGRHRALKSSFCNSTFSRSLK